MPAPVLKLLAAAVADSDADLLGRFVAARDEAAFAELVRRHGPPVYRVCRRLAGPSSAEDAFQATFLVLACRAKAVRKAASVGSWLIGVAGRVSRQMRALDRRAAGVSRLFGGGLEQPADAGRPPEVAELSRILDDELSRLPASLRDPVTLCLVDGRTQEQAAAALGGSVRTVRRRLDRAKAVLRARLERRGVVPAVAAGLVAGVGGPAVAVPTELARRTVAGVSSFLTGGGADTPAAVAAKGVVGSMVKLKVSAAMATAAAVMIGLGVGLADEGPRPNAPPADPPPKVAEKPPEAGAVPPKPDTTPERWEEGNRDRRPNFLVQAPTWQIGQIVAREAEYLYRWLTNQAVWNDPVQRDEPVRIRVTLTAGPGSGSTTFNFPLGKPEPKAEMTLSGRLEDVLTDHLPREVMRLVLARHLGGPLPGWADQGVARAAGSDAGQKRDDARVRELLAAGRAARLGVLFVSREASPDIAAQGASVVRFLRFAAKASLAPELWYYPEDGTFGPADQTRGPLTIATSYSRVIGFVRLGMDGNTPESWAKAARQMDGFASLDELEDAWLEWLKTPASRWEPEPAKPPKPPRKPDDGSGRIPPTAVPGGPLPAKLPPAAPKPAEPDPAAAAHKSANFFVTAPTAELAERFAAAAERHRKQLAERWLGKELPAWGTPVRVRVNVTPGPTGGATTFTYGDRRMTSAEMEVHGTVRQILDAALPHEVMHTVLADHFGKPLPRWADEGIAITAESEAEQRLHEVKVRECVNAGRGLRASVLFRLTEYPRDAHVLFVEGHALVRFLLDHGRKLAQAPAGAGGRAELLEFVRLGMDGNTAASWDRAAKEVYGFASVDALEDRWLDSLRPPASARPAAEPDHLPPAGRAGERPRRPAAGDPDDIFGYMPLGTRTIEFIPENKPDERARTRQTRVYLSADKGRTWQLNGTFPPTSERLFARTTGDGPYWVATVREYSDGTTDRDAPGDGPVTKLLVDTVPPEVRATARRDGDGVAVEWAVADTSTGAWPNLQPAAVLHRPAADPKGGWTEVEVPFTDARTRIAPAKAGPVEVRVKVRDAAGNVGVSATVTVD